MAAQGRDRDRHGPAQRRDPRARQLAAGRTPTRPATRPTTRARTARSAPPTSRARRSRRSPSPARSRSGEVTPTRRSTCRRRSRSPTARSASRTRAATVTLTTREILKQSSQRRRGHDRPAARRRATSTSGCAASASASRPASTSRARSSGIVLPLAKYSGRVDGQPADRPGHRGHADADGGRLLRDRQRRRPAPAAHRRGGRRARGEASPQGHRVISEATAASLRKMLEGVLGPGGTASGAAIDGYELAGKTGTAEKPDPRTAATRRPSTSRRSSASRPRGARSCSSP